MTPWPEVRRLVSVALQDYWASRATAAGTTTTLVDTRLQRVSEETDGLGDYYVLVLDGVAAGEVRKAKKTSGYAPGTGTLTVSEAWTEAPGIGASYELHRHHPIDIKRAAVHEAIRALAQDLWVPLVDDSLVVDDHLAANAGYEIFLESRFPNWTLTGAGATVAKEAIRVWHGEQSAFITAGAGAAATLTQNVFSRTNVKEQASATAEFKRWVWASAASTVRLGINFTGTPTYGGYHTGDSTWRLLTSDAIAIPTTATELTPTVQVAAAGTAYVDGGGGSGLFIGGKAVHSYPYPERFTRPPYAVEQQALERYPRGAYYPIGYSNMPRSRYGLRLRGEGYLTLPMSETDIVEVDGGGLSLLVAQAMEWLYGARAGELEVEESAARRRADWAVRVERQRAGHPGLTHPSVNMRQGWGVDQVDRTIVLER